MLRFVVDAKDDRQIGMAKSSMIWIGKQHITCSVEDVANGIHNQEV